jgi:hypothetical protein
MNMIEYFDRYSSTDLPDDMGRWARTAVYKNIRIAWISRKETDKGIVFLVSLSFPTMQNDTANEHKVFFSLEESKDFVKERWEWFLNIVTFSSLDQILGKQTDFKLANEIKEIQAMEVFNYIVNEHNVKLTYEEWRKTVKKYYR